MVPAEVSALGTYAYDLADVLRNALGSAAKEVDRTCGSDWRSTASKSFAKGWDECRVNGEAIIDALTTMANSLGVTAETHAGADNQFAAELKSSSLDLPPL
ncbi:WXG100 family type VII secretion target [Nocardia stercoris]|uniref:WXG100 family type VII secretion target n=1 Tax=Nocardia stercoris TaxID=2483361 RepID=A0A3M2L3Z3_9NOCA|nr:WXG100 family type VII secretion target [Nocardia stercoris]RMI32271.1 WXG100 family type VII secretion target [Nocardia stercoris]